jgi:hypothetical protein
MPGCQGGTLCHSVTDHLRDRLLQTFTSDGICCYGNTAVLDECIGPEQLSESSVGQWVKLTGQNYHARWSLNRTASSLRHFLPIPLETIAFLLACANSERF